MSDGPVIESSHPGTLSPRIIDTLTYRVLKPLPKEVAPVGGTFTSWPQGEVFACVSGLGLGPVRNADILDWLERGLIVRETPLTPAQERALHAQTRAAAAQVAETASDASAATAAAPWPYPGVGAVAPKPD